MPSGSEYSEEFIEEDDVGDSEEEELLEARIAEEHVKFKQAQEERQAKVRETRAWSAPHLESPRPEEQRERRVESAKLSGEEAEATVAVPRNEYEPVSRPSAAGKPSTLQDILEVDEAPTPTANQSAASEGSVADDKASASAAASPEASSESLKPPAPAPAAAPAAASAAGSTAPAPAAAPATASAAGNTAPGLTAGTAASAPPPPASVVAASVVSVQHGAAQQPGLMGRASDGVSHAPFKDSSIRGSVLGSGYGGVTASEAGRWVVGERSAGSLLKDEDEEDEEDEGGIGGKGGKGGAKGVIEEGEEEEEEEEEEKAAATSTKSTPLPAEKEEVKHLLEQEEEVSVAGKAAAAAAAIEAPAAKPPLQPPIPSDSPAVSAVCVPTSLPAVVDLSLEDTDSVYIEEDDEETDVEEDVVPLSAINLGSKVQAAKPVVAAAAAAGSVKVEEEEEEEERAEMMAPHDFALRLLTHDLRTLPAHQAAAAAAGAPPLAVKRPQSGKSRYHGKAVAAATGPGPAAVTGHVGRSSRPFSAPSGAPQTTAAGKPAAGLQALPGGPRIQRQASIASSTGWSGVKTTGATLKLSHTLCNGPDRRDELLEAEKAAAAAEQEAEASGDEASGGGWDSGSEAAPAPVQAPVDRSRAPAGGSERGGSLERGATAAGAEGDDGSGMMAPHDFALRLLTHDLRTLPAHSQAAAATAGRLPSASGRRPDSGKATRYPAPAAAERPSRSTPQQQRSARPSSAPMAHSAAAASTRASAAAAAPGRGERQVYSARPRRAPSESSSHGWSEAQAGAELTLEMSRAMREVSMADTDGGWVAPAAAAMVRSASSNSRMVSLADPAGAAVNRLSWEGGAARYGAAPDGPARGLGTAPVSVGGVNVSVYVADTAKQILAANRWLAMLGSSKRYQLRDPSDNSYIQLVGGEAWADGEGEQNSASVLKTMPLSQFLSALKQLKARPARSERGFEEEEEGGGGAQELMFRDKETADWYRGAAGSEGGAGALKGGGADGSEELPVNVAEAVHSEVKAAANRCKQLATQVSMLRLRPPRSKA